MSAPAPRPQLKLELPTLDETGSTGGHFVRRAVTWTLGTLAVLVTVAVVAASLITLHVTVRAPGAMEPVRIWPVRALEAGTVQRVLVGTGDTVKAGTPVVQLDPLALQSSLDQLQAQVHGVQIDAARSVSAGPVEERQREEKVAQAQAQLVRARASLRQRLVENGMSGNVDSVLAVYRIGQHVVLDLAVAEIRSAESAVRAGATERDMLGLERYDREKQQVQVEQLQGQIRATRERLSRLTLTAPTHGVVLTEQIERLPGTYVREGEQLLEVADLDAWRVTMLVRERDVHRIRLGDSVLVEVNAFNADEDERLHGSVVYVSPEPLGTAAAAGGAAPSAPQSSGLYRVVARLDQAQLARIGIQKFRRGFGVDGQIVTRRGRVIVLVWDYLMDRVKGRA
ncbi:MAG TPA: efflux RND transporter periplasmic adaptor subunit [Longimicrobiaceae bacterium]|nr:efflux RND transporter periplasmic adaptor subunit [Longimicrobiaceae bacterium]